MDKLLGTIQEVEGIIYYSKKEIKEMYPQVSISNEPLKNCPNCQGSGVYVKKWKTRCLPCACVCVSHSDEVVRRRVVRSYYQGY